MNAFEHLRGRGTPGPVLLPSERRVLAFLMPLSPEYPGIDRWFVSKVVPGLRTGTRMLFEVERDGSLVGLGIAKNEFDERKICTVRVAPSHAGRGIGVRLFDGMLRWLDDDRPHLTVGAARLPSFERIFDYYRFELTSSQAGRYVPRSTELGFNEALPACRCRGPVTLVATGPVRP